MLNTMLVYFNVQVRCLHFRHRGFSLPRSAKRNASTTGTNLKLDLSDSSPLFSYTSGRWLANNNAQLAARYVKFNVEALHHVAARAVGANSVTSMSKIAENYHRTFLLTFDNEKEAIVRVPTSLSGPPHLTTASEVATNDFLRKIGIPTPRVLAWSSRSESTDVGCEFVMVEKACGRPLSEVGGYRGDKDIMLALAQVLRPLANLQFKYYGSIYYTKDVPADKRRGDFLVNPPPSLDLSSFVVGPMAAYEYWEAERGVMDEISKGPWSSAMEYSFHTALREQLWMRSHAASSLFDSHLCIVPHQGKVEDHIRLLEQYKDLLPHIIPSNPTFSSGRLWHTDLTPDKIFIRELPKLVGGAANDDDVPQVEITALTEWQDAYIKPAYLHLATPDAIQSPDTPSSNKLPDPVNPDDYPNQEELNAAKVVYRNEMIHKIFELETFPDILQCPARDLRIQLDMAAQVTWKAGLISLRTFFHLLTTRWNEIAPGQTCPYQMSDEELDYHLQSLQFWTRHWSVAEEYSKEFNLDFGGHYIFGKDTEEGAREFERIRETLEERRVAMIAEGTTDEEKEIKALLWPFRDTLLDNPRTHLIVDR